MMGLEYIYIYIYKNCTLLLSYDKNVKNDLIIRLLSHELEVFKWMHVLIAQNMLIIWKYAVLITWIL